MSTILESFGEVVMEARNSGVQTFLSFRDKGWTPKKANDQQQALMDLLKELDPSQKEKLLKTIQYCVDLSFFKLLDNLEMGSNNLQFELKAKRENEEEVLISDSDDMELRSKFWSWLEKHGV